MWTLCKDPLIFITTIKMRLPEFIFCIPIENLSFLDTKAKLNKNAFL